MAHKNRMTVADILMALRQQLVTAHAEKNVAELNWLASLFDSLWEVAAQASDPKAMGLLDDLTSAANHFLGGVDFKAWPTVPSIEAIQEMESAAANYEKVSAKLIRRVAVRKELHPLNLGFNGITEEKIEPDWIGIAFTQGPYQDTFDLLFYKFDGRLIAWHQCDTLEQALRFIEESCGIQESEWESCEMELTDKDGKYIWKPGEK